MEHLGDHLADEGVVRHRSEGSLISSEQTLSKMSSSGFGSLISWAEEQQIVWKMPNGCFTLKPMEDTPMVELPDGRLTETARETLTGHSSTLS
jgi:hypothetical protein